MNSTVDILKSMLFVWFMIGLISCIAGVIGFLRPDINLDGRIVFVLFLFGMVAPTGWMSYIWSDE